jgi:hypothetical protein
MRVSVEVDIQEGMVKILDGIAKKLKIKEGHRGLLSQELNDKLAEIEVWMERFSD